MRIEFVGHASFIVDAAGIRLICDPWLEGTAFDDGWKLLSEPAFRAEDWQRISHIWISHEHPDHFSPASLRAIPAEARARITVLFQRTRDHKVAAFCRGLGFRRVVELAAGRWAALGQDFRVCCQPVAGDDSWLAVESGGKRLLNLNDCVLTSERRLRQVLGRAGGKPDVLLTQFSYANWVGNPDEPERQRAAATEQLQRVRTQCRVLQPRSVVPFASFVWFCHEENRYLNDGMNTVEDAVSAIAETGASPVVLYPGDTWQVGEQHDNSTTIAQYNRDYAAVGMTSEVLKGAPVGESELLALGREHAAKLRRALGAWSRPLRGRLVRPARVFVSDVGQAYRLDLTQGLTPIETPEVDCDVSLTAGALRYVLEHLWGGNTLLVNGRFRAPPAGDFERFRAFLVLGDFANHGRAGRLYTAYRARAAVTPVAQRLLGKVGLYRGGDVGPPGFEPRTNRL